MATNHFEYSTTVMTGTADGARMERTLNVCGVGLENCIVTIFGLVVSLLTKRPFNC